MRIGLAWVVCVLSGCASSGGLSSAPPAGIDLSGHWQLNAADSDDPQRLMQSQIAAATASTTADGQTSSRGRGGRGAMPTGPMGPIMPSVLVLDEALRWPGRDLLIAQASGAVTFTSDGSARLCRVHEGGQGHHHPPSGGGAGGGSGRDSPHGRGDAPPPRCGWDEKTLVVQSGEPDEDRPPFEQRFSVSEDGQRLEELVVFRGGRSSGFVASREWDRVAAGSAPAAAPAVPQNK
jgi:hypothetical protein